MNVIVLVISLHNLKLGRTVPAKDPFQDIGAMIHGLYIPNPMYCQYTLPIQFREVGEIYVR